MQSAAFEHIMAALRSRINPEDAAHQQRYHKAPRVYLGLRVPEMTAIAKEAGKLFSETELFTACRELWDTDIHDARITAGKILKLRQIADQRSVWDFLDETKKDLDTWAIADALEHAAHRCLQSHPGLLDEMERHWLTHPSFWVRRASLVNTLYLAKPGQNPERPLRWAEILVHEREWFIQKAIAWWLRERSKHDPDCVRSFLNRHGKTMKAFARREAEKYIRT